MTELKDTAGVDPSAMEAVIVTDRIKRMLTEERPFIQTIDPPARLVGTQCSVH